MSRVPPVFVNPPDFIIDTDGTYIWAIDGATGQVETQDSTPDLFPVLQDIFAVLPTVTVDDPLVGVVDAITGHIHIKPGRYPLLTRISQPADSRLMITGGGTTFQAHTWGRGGGTQLYIGDVNGMWTSQNRGFIVMKDIEFAPTLADAGSTAVYLDAQLASLKNVQVVNYPALSGSNTLNARGIWMRGAGNDRGYMESCAIGGFYRGSTIECRHATLINCAFSRGSGLRVVSRVRQRFINTQIYTIDDNFIAPLDIDESPEGEVPIEFDGLYFEAITTTPLIRQDAIDNVLIILRGCKLDNVAADFSNVNFSNCDDRIRLEHCMGDDGFLYDSDKEGVVTGISTAAVARVSAAVVFPTQFLPGTVPNVQLTLENVNAAVTIDTVYVTAVSATGFTYNINVTASVGATTCDLRWRATRKD